MPTFKPPMTLDQIDLGLLHLYSLFPQLTAPQLAQHLHISTANITRRLADLEADGILEQPPLRIHLPRMGYTVTAFILGRMDRSTTPERLVTDLQHMPQVLAIYCVTGSYDVVLQVAAPGLSELATLLKDTLRTVGKLEHAECLMCLEQPLARHSTFSTCL